MRLNFIALVAISLFLPFSAVSQTKLLNVSYDPTRELYKEYNSLFADYWKRESGESIEIRQSHGGSGKQARAVIDGLEADVVTLALAYDIDQIAKTGKLIKEDWAHKFTDNSAPYYSTIVFLVRKGNPKGIKNWDDLLKPEVSIVTPNPKTSGGARWNYLALWGFLQRKFNGDEEQIKKSMQEIFSRVPVMDSGARGSTTTFVQRQIGDVLITWENEAYLAQEEFGVDKVEVVTPSVSIMAEPPVAVVDVNCEKHKSCKQAEAYLKYLYSAPAQAIIAKHHYRARNIDAFKRSNLPKLELFNINDVFGGWNAAHTKHFAEGAIFDKLFAAAKGTGA